MQFGLCCYHDATMQMDGYTSTTCTDGRMQWPPSPVSPLAPPFLLNKSVWVRLFLNYNSTFVHPRLRVRSIARVPDSFCKLVTSDCRRKKLINQQRAFSDHPVKLRMDRYVDHSEIGP